MCSCARRWCGSILAGSVAPTGGNLRACIGRAYGFSPAQTTRLIRQQGETGTVVNRRARNSGRSFETVYTAAHIRLLADLDEVLGKTSGQADLRAVAPHVGGPRRPGPRAPGEAVAFAPVTTWGRRGPTAPNGRKRAPARWLGLSLPSPARLWFHPAVARAPEPPGLRLPLRGRPAGEAPW